MLGNYLLIAWRTLLANRLFSAINVLGLAIGLASSILILTFVSYELSYDRQWEQADRTVRVTRNFTSMGLHLAAVAPPFGPLLEADFPELEAVTRIWANPMAINVGDRAFDNQIVGLADPSVFDVFELGLDPASRPDPLAQPFQAVLSRSAADRLFGRTDVIGETFSLLGQVDVAVTGVMDDLPANTHLDFDLLISLSSMFAMFAGEDQDFGSNNYYTYLVLPPSLTMEALQDRLPAFLQKHLGEEAPEWNALTLQRLTDIHLHSQLEGEMSANGDIDVVLVFSAIALVILGIACVNFMNLTTARSTQRAKEVGVRKVAGATRPQLMAQFLGESILLTAIAMLLALALVELLLPWFAAFVERDLAFPWLRDPALLGTLALGTVLVGLVAGSYPAVLLSSFRPAAVLKGDLAHGGGAATVRKILVVAQFAVSIALMIATGVVLAQLRHAQAFDVGWDRAHQVTLQLPFRVDGSTFEQYEPLRLALEASPAIESVTAGSRVPTGQLLDGSSYAPQGSSLTPDERVPLRDLRVVDSYIEQFGIDVVAGRAFSREQGDRLATAPDEENPVSRGQIMLNETAVRTLGYGSPQEAVGKVLLQTDEDAGRRMEWTVVGVTADFNFSSLHNAIEPTIFLFEGEHVFNVIVKTVPGSLDAALAHVDATWAEQFPTANLNRAFLDERFEAMYRQEGRQAQVFAIFAGLAIFVACLGLFGLASFTTERRTKEIGIRKVMGASVRDIVLLLTKEFSVLVLVANLIAWPVAWYFMSDWLTRFVYRIDLGPLLFGAAALAAFAVAWLTVAAQAGKAAMARPVRSLRYE